MAGLRTCQSELSESMSNMNKGMNKSTSQPAFIPSRMLERSGTVDLRS